MKPCVWLIKNADREAVGCVYVDFMASQAEGKWKAMTHALADEFPDLLVLVDRAVDDHLLVQVGPERWVLLTKGAWDYRNLSPCVLEALFNTYSTMTIEQVELWDIERMQNQWER